jgi:predicted phosphodiesterase
MNSLEKWLLVSALILTGCASAGPPRLGPTTLAEYPISAALKSKTPLRLVLIGDTGEETGARDSIVREIAKERADLILVLGDLVYPRGPSCEGDTLNSEARSKLDQHIGRPFAQVGAPVLLVLGNHDVLRKVVGIDRPRVHQEACYYLYAKENAGKGFVLPARHYGITLGPATLAVVSSSRPFLTDSAGRMTSSLFNARTDDWDIVVAHHVYRTFHDKYGERIVQTWLEKYALRPAVVVNGHAHFLQMGSYNGVLAITSGGGAKERPQARCRTGDAMPGKCVVPGEYFGHEGAFGYAILELTSTDARVEFKDQKGASLWSCRAKRGSASCVPD